jgi:hypothetical protein
MFWAEGRAVSIKLDHISTNEVRGTFVKGGCDSMAGYAGRMGNQVACMHCATGLVSWSKLSGGVCKRHLLLVDYMQLRFEGRRREIGRGWPEVV